MGGSRISKAVSAPRNTAHTGMSHAGIIEPVRVHTHARNAKTKANEGTNHVYPHLSHGR